VNQEPCCGTVVLIGLRDNPPTVELQALRFGCDEAMLATLGDKKLAQNSQVFLSRHCF
jgi:hypothetical protein